MHQQRETLLTPWRAFLMLEALRTINENDLSAFVRLLQTESWLLGESCVGFQVVLFEQATLRDRAAFITQLIDLGDAATSPRAAIGFALTGVLPAICSVAPMTDWTDQV